MDSAIRAVADTCRFDALFIEDEYPSWNEMALEFSRAVKAELVSRWPGRDAAIAEYVGLNLLDWLWLPSPGEMEAFVRESLGLRNRWGFRRDLLDQKYLAETFHPPRGSSLPRITLRDVDGATMVDFLSFWPRHPHGFTRVHAITDSMDALIVLDVDAREQGWLAPDLLRDVEHLVGRWHGLLGEHRGFVYQAEMRVRHDGIERFASSWGGTPTHSTAE